MTLAEVKNMSKRYGDKTVVDNVSFEVKEQECFGILGHNGAGKTTLIEMMLGLKKADKGKAKLLQTEMTVRKGQLFEEVGVQLQSSSYHPMIKVKELLAERSVLYKKECDLKELLTTFSLQDKMNQKVETLSGGEKQRLSVMLAVMHDPKLIFLDELTTGMDAVARREIWKYLIHLKEKGKSLILTSHYMDEVEVLCDRILILEQGKILITGTVEEVIKASPYSTLEQAYLWFMKEEALI